MPTKTSLRTKTTTLLAVPVENVLRRGRGVNGCHHAVLNSEGLLEDLGEGSETVGRARGIRDDIHVGFVLLAIDADDLRGRGQTSLSQ